MLVDTVGDAYVLRNDRRQRLGVAKSVYIRKRQLLLEGVENSKEENVSNCSQERK